MKIHYFSQCIDILLIANMTGDDRIPHLKQFNKLPISLEQGKFGN